MKLFHIERKLVAENPFKVIEHRLLVTPLFTKNLKPYLYQYESGWFVAFFFSWPRESWPRESWLQVKKKDKYWCDKDKINELNSCIQSTFGTENRVVRFKKCR